MSCRRVEDSKEDSKVADAPLQSKARRGVELRNAVFNEGGGL
jgi:hypothetical protein